MQTCSRKKKSGSDSVSVEVDAFTWLSGWCQGLDVPQSPPTKFGQNWDYSGGRKAWMTSVRPLFCRMHSPLSASPFRSLLISLFFSFPPLHFLSFCLLLYLTDKALVARFWSESPWGKQSFVCIRVHLHRNLYIYTLCVHKGHVQLFINTDT